MGGGPSRWERLRERRLADPPARARYERTLRGFAVGGTTNAARVFVDPSSRLPAEALSMLREGGFDTDPPRADDATTLERSADAARELLESSLTVAEVARRLGVGAGAVHGWLRARRLDGFRRRGRWFVPTFQLDGRGVAPGLDRVLPQLPASMHPLAVVRWFDTPQPDLVPSGDREQRPLAPIDWLRTGGDCAVVAGLAESAAGYV
jgi:hypothetical protein